MKVILRKMAVANGLSQDIVGYIAIQIDKNEIKYDQQSQVLIAFTLSIFWCTH